MARVGKKKRVTRQCCLIKTFLIELESPSLLMESLRFIWNFSFKYEKEIALLNDNQHCSAGNIQRSCGFELSDSEQKLETKALTLLGKGTECPAPSPRSFWLMFQIIFSTWTGEKHYFDEVSIDRKIISYLTPLLKIRTWVSEELKVLNVEKSEWQIISSPGKANSTCLKLGISSLKA